MSYVKIQIIHSKSCPFCEFFIKEVIRPLMTMFPDLLVVEFREFAMGFQEYKHKMRGFRSKEGLSTHSYSGYYAPKYGRLPEIVIDDRRYIVSAMNYITAYKLFKEIRKKIESLPFLTSEIRSYQITSFLNEMEDYLKQKVKEQKVEHMLASGRVRIIRMYGAPVRVYDMELNSQEDVDRFLREVDPKCSYIVVCLRGISARDLANKLRGKGIDAVGMSYEEFNSIVSANTELIMNLMSNPRRC